MSVSSLHIIGGRKLGGAERFFVRLVNALARHGEPVYTVTVPGGEIDAAVDAGVRRRHAPLAGVWDLWSRYRIGRFARTDLPDIVQTYMGRATRLTRLPRGRTPVHVARLGGFYNLNGYRHAHAWVGNTRGICDYLVREGLPADRVFHIGNFVDPAPAHSSGELSALRQQWRIPAEAYVILGVGRLHPYKGFSDLLQAFARLPSAVQGRPVHLAMVGDGPLRAQLATEAGQLRLAGRIAWAGWQYDPSIWYQMADLFVCSSRHETLGNVILEAWANGVPVVSTAAQGPLELIEDGIDGLLAPLAAPERLAGVLREALELDAATRLRLIEAGRAKLAAKFSEAAIVSAYLDLYAKLASHYR